MRLFAAVLFFANAAKQSDTVMPDEPTNRQIVAIIITVASKTHTAAFFELCLRSTFRSIPCFLLFDRVTMIIYKFLPMRKPPRGIYTEKHFC